VLGAMLSGGKLFDEGQYGCIFTPPLECKTKTKQVLAEDGSELPLSKLILTDDAEHEYGISKVIRQIPLWKNYFVVSESICEPAAQQKDKELKDCPVLDTYKLSDFRILSMPYGGVPLNLYRIDLAKFDFMAFITHFIEAGALMNLFGVVHRDIHQGNILVDDEHVPRIIDFNLAIFAQKPVTTSLLTHTYNVVTGQEPPDSTLVNAIHLGHNAERVIDSIINKKPIMRKIRNILGISADAQLQTLEKFYLDSKSVKSGNSAGWFNNYWRTIDSWAIGVNIIILILKLSLWPEFALTLKRVRPKLFPVLKALCEVSPVKRIDCVQALNIIAPNSFIIRKYGKAWLAKVGTA
jgi:serine/threonine protein kinase